MMSKEELEKKLKETETELERIKEMVRAAKENAEEEYNKRLRIFAIVKENLERKHEERKELLSKEEFSQARLLLFEIEELETDLNRERENVTAAYAAYKEINNLDYEVKWKQ